MAVAVAVNPMAVVEALLLILAATMIVATLLPLFRAEAWWIRIFDFPRLQIVAVIGVVGTLLGWQLDAGGLRNAVLVALAACLAIQLARIRPYTLLARVQVLPCGEGDPGNGISLLSANVLQSNRDAGRLLALIREADPDVVLALETDAWWLSQLDVLAATHPFVVRQPQEDTYGMLLYSRLELVAPRVDFLIEPDIPSIHAELRLRSGRAIQLHCLHPRPPSPTESDSSLERDAELLIVGRHIKAHPAPAIALGDLNDVAWSHTSALFRDISGLLDPRIGRGFFNTFNAKNPLLRFPLDHFFHTNDFRLVDFRRLAYFGSDHFPVFIHLSHEPHAAGRQPEPQADAAQQHEASDKIAEAG